MRPLAGADEEWLAWASPDLPTATVVTELLGRTVTRIGPLVEPGAAGCRDLLVGDRDYLILWLRRLTLGTHFAARLVCTTCGERIDLEFDAADVPVERRPQTGRVHEVDLVGSEGRDVRVAFRLPTGGDQEAVARAPAAERAQALLRRCVVAVDGDEADEAVDALDATTREALDDALAERAPAAELAMDVVCPNCETAYGLDYELAPLVLEELALSPRRLLREVHALAFHYRWSEREILALSRVKRRAYLELIADELLRDSER